MELLATMNYWGLSYDNIVAMFALNAEDLQKKILNCMSGPTSFNALAMEKQQSVTTCCDIYGSTKAELKIKAAKAIDQAITYIEGNPERFLATVIQTPKVYRKFLQENLKISFDNYDSAVKQGRYSSEALPEISFVDNQFDLALCPHFLFAAHKNFTVEFQLHSIKELCRVAPEARIFPLIDVQGKLVAELPQIISELEQQGYRCELAKVGYQLEKGNDTMLKVYSIHK